MRAEVPLKKDHRGVKVPDISGLQANGNTCVVGYEIVSVNKDTAVIEYRVMTRKGGA